MRTRHMSKTNQKTKKVRNTDPTKKKRVELWCSRMVDRSCFISDTRVLIIVKPVKFLVGDKGNRVKMRRHLKNSQPVRDNDRRLFYTDDIRRGVLDTPLCYTVCR